MECKHIGEPKLQKRGTLRTEVYMWLMFPLGLPYTLWRMLGKIPYCAQCNGTILYRTDCDPGHRLALLAEGKGHSALPKTQDNAATPMDKQPAISATKVKPDEW